MQAGNAIYETIADLPPVLPVFPLAGALLLPRTQLPLNIFEQLANAIAIQVPSPELRPEANPRHRATPGACTVSEARARRRGQETRSGGAERA